MKLARVGIWLVVGTGVVGGTPCGAAAQDSAHGVFVFHDSVTVPGAEDRAFDAFVDVNAWWDRRFSQTSVRFFIEPKVGGGFWELFDDEGNGVRHAEVIYVRRPSVLRMEGPLSLSGNAIQLVFTLQFTARGDSTVVALEVHGAGEVREEWPQVVQSVWHHFLAERYKPHVEGRLEPPTRAPQPPATAPARTGPPVPAPTLPEGEGILRISASPVAEIIISGSSKGVRSRLVDTVRAGKYMIRLVPADPSYADTTLVVEVAPGGGNPPVVLRLRRR